jgi:hypothetical protein
MENLSLCICHHIVKKLQSRCGYQKHPARILTVKMCAVRNCVQTHTQFRLTPTLTMGAACSSETSISTYKIAWCHNPADHNPNITLLKHFLPSSISLEVKHFQWSAHTNIQVEDLFSRLHMQSEEKCGKKKWGSGCNYIWGG